VHRPPASRLAPDVFPGPGVVQRGMTHLAPGLPDGRSPREGAQPLGPVKQVAAPHPRGAVQERSLPLCVVATGPADPTRRADGGSDVAAGHAPASVVRP